MLLALARRRGPACGGRSIGWIVAAVLLHMAALMPVFVTERYRLAAVPGLLLLAAFGLWEFWSFLSRARWAPALSYACAGVAAAFCVATPPADAALWSLDFYNTGVKALDQQDYPGARRDLEKAFRYVPENTEVNFCLGLLWQSQGDERRAKIFYKRALTLNPRHAGAWNNLGVLASKEKAWPVAQRCFARALEVEPGDATTNYLQARACAQMGEWSQAQASIDTARRLRPGQKEFEQLAAEIQTRGPLTVE
jgi:tetratricopeptide (TPR) repeat protein